MKIKAFVWDKKSPINGKDAAFLTEHFKKQNGNDDRVLISYDGVICRIEGVDDSRFTAKEKSRLAELMEAGANRNNAIAEVWGEKALKEYDEGERKAAEEAARQKDEANKIAQLEADLLYMSIMTGVDLDA